MSLRRNILANYASQAYVTLAMLVMLPLYLRYMGAEAYGLVGFFTMLNAFFMLLDVGLSPTLSRETARFQGGAIDAPTLCGLVRILELIFVSVAVLAFIGFVFAADFFAGQWLKVEHLALDEVQAALILMGLTIPLRWMSGLYRSAVNGFERQVWLAGFNILIATSRFVGVLIVFEVIDTTPTTFFSYQLVIAVLELSGLAWMTYRLLPAQSTAQTLHQSWQALKGVLRFSLTIAFTGAVWVLVTQVDKLVLSSMLTLSEYGYFTLAVVVASGVNLIGAPITQALQPRLTRMIAEGNEDEAITLYRKATQLVTILAAPAALALAVFAAPVMWAWTGNPVAVEKAAPVLVLYAIGNGLLALVGLSYALQYAKGDLRLHVIGNAVLLVLMVPCLIWAASRWGAMGAGWTWLVSIGLYLLLWVPKIHERMSLGLHTPWLIRDVLPIIGTTSIIGLGMAINKFMPTSRLESGLFAVGCGMLILAVAIIASSSARTFLCNKVNRCRTEFTMGSK